MPYSLTEKLREDVLRQLAGRLVYSRGQEYARNGQVSQWHKDGEQISATVQGQQMYEVRLWLRQNELHSHCTCAFAAEGAFCKHCVAVAIVINSAADTSR